MAITTRCTLAADGSEALRVASCDGVPVGYFTISGGVFSAVAAADVDCSAPLGLFPAAAVFPAPDLFPLPLI